MATLILTFPTGSASAVTLLTLTGSPAATTSLPLSFTGPVAVTGGDQWTATYAGAAVSYSYTATATISGVASPFSGSNAPGDGNPSGIYCSLADVYDVFGLRNISDWSNLDGVNESVDLARCARALSAADEKINAEFRGSAFSVPLVLTAGADTVKEWAAKLAGIWLYTNRGQLDTIASSDGISRPYNKYAGMAKDVYADMRNYKNGLKQFSGSLSGVKAVPFNAGTRTVCR